MIAVWRMLGCDRCLGMLGVRSVKIRVVCDRLKLGLSAIAVWGCWGAIAKRCCKQFV
ncbi:hypothetical protein H6G25_16550 [Dolichospermum sp. FACHB-1091]|uniref:hypothetical protein n=1 Tax=Dolichospermum sp. FACHB-1091 TaxID=2692798 RepID=UPI001681A805|nr:hypothetical protein [Dolichospermum sp. FACHB-1091]MBD2444765.1 hypothetical protein [Dolichospermum sp. FACHB-1091]